MKGVLGLLAVGLWMALVRGQEEIWVGGENGDVFHEYAPEGVSSGTSMDDMEWVVASEESGDSAQYWAIPTAASEAEGVAEARIEEIVKNTTGSHVGTVRIQQVGEGDAQGVVDTGVSPVMAGLGPTPTPSVADAIPMAFDGPNAGEGIAVDVGGYPEEGIAPGGRDGFVTERLPIINDMEPLYDAAVGDVDFGAGLAAKPLDGQGVSVPQSGEVQLVGVDPVDVQPVEVQPVGIQPIGDEYGWEYGTPYEADPTESLYSDMRDEPVVAEGNDSADGDTFRAVDMGGSVISQGLPNDPKTVMGVDGSQITKSDCTNDAYGTTCPDPCAEDDTIFFCPNDPCMKGDAVNCADPCTADTRYPGCANDICVSNPGGNICTVPCDIDDTYMFCDNDPCILKTGSCTDPCATDLRYPGCSQDACVSDPGTWECPDPCARGDTYAGCSDPPEDDTEPDSAFSPGPTPYTIALLLAILLPLIL